MSVSIRIIDYPLFTNVEGTRDDRIVSFNNSAFCINIYAKHRVITSFLLKRNGPNDPNKMISKFYGCKIGQGE